MDLASLYNLLSNFTDEKHRLDTTVQSTDNRSQRVALERQAQAVAVIVADIRGELLARELPGARSTGTAQEFETHLHRVLKAYARMALARGSVPNAARMVMRETAASHPDATPSRLRSAKASS